MKTVNAERHAPHLVPERRAKPGVEGLALLLLLLLATGCIQTTGGRIVAFEASASGDPAVVSGGPLTFTSGRGFDVTLTRARVLVGAMYFSAQNPQNYTLETACIQPGVYTGEVRAGLLVDALDPAPRAFAIEGNGTDAQTLAAELWLTSGDVTADDDKAVVLDVAGEARRGADRWPFEGALTIGRNRVIPPRNAALPGSNPLCQQRIVSPVPFEARLAEGMAVRLLVDPRAFFASVDFSALTKASDAPLLYVFGDDGASSVQPDKALFNGLRAATGPWRFETSSP